MCMYGLFAIDNTQKRNSDAEFWTCLLAYEKTFSYCSNKVQGATMYSSTSVIWIVHMLTLNLRIKGGLGVVPSITLLIVAINPATVVAAINFNLDVFILLL